eukprot:3214669-Prymnesium_polylepis.1
MARGEMYNWRVNAVHNALQQRGKAEGPLEISDLTALGHLDQVRATAATTWRCAQQARLHQEQRDSTLIKGSRAFVPRQYHYLGTEACDHVIELLGLDEQSTVLDIGSGIGGPARYIAGKTGCSVTGVELQEDLCQVGVRGWRALAAARIDRC